MRVLPEIETPGHGACRAKAMPQLNLSTCPDVLNPTLNSTYDFLLTLLSEIAPIFPEPTIFLGGDEVKYAFIPALYRFKQYQSSYTGINSNLDCAHQSSGRMRRSSDFSVHCAS